MINMAFVLDRSIFLVRSVLPLVIPSRSHKINQATYSYVTPSGKTGTVTVNCNSTQNFETLILCLKYLLILLVVALMLLLLLLWGLLLVVVVRLSRGRGLAIALAVSRVLIVVAIVVLVVVALIVSLAVVLAVALQGEKESIKHGHTITFL